MNDPIKQKSRPLAGTADAGKRLGVISDILASKSSPDTNALIEAIRDHAAVTAAASIYAAHYLKGSGVMRDSLIEYAFDDVAAIHREHEQRKRGES